MQRVALYSSGGSPYHHAAIFARAGSEVGFVFPADIEQGALDAYDAFVMPGGGYLAMKGQLDPLGNSGCRAIRDYVEQGGMYIGSCAGSYCAATVPASFLRMCPGQADLCLLDAQIWNGADSPSFVGIQSPGIGTIRAENASPGHPVMAGMPSAFSITHYNGPLFKSGEALARVQGRGTDFTPAEEFLGGTAGPLLIDQAAARGVANVVAGRRGKGRVVLFGSHPEFGASVAMDDDSEASQMLLNALRWQLDESGTPGRAPAVIASEAGVSAETAAADRDLLPSLVARITERCAELGAASDSPGWLSQKSAMSMFGLPPRDIWNAALERIPELVREVMAAVPDVRPALLSFRAPAGWQLDGGFHGVVPLLEQADEQLARATANWSMTSSGDGTDPYADILDSPYHLVAGSYLAAIGRVAGAALLCRIALAAETARTR